jgi:hypothetical protein
VTPRQLPAATALTRPQYSGWACVWCNERLQSGAVPAGRAEGRVGGHDPSIEVCACPGCAVPETSRKES